MEDIDRALVINGKIEEGSTALVQISYSEDIDAMISPINYEENASVTLISGDGSREQLVYTGGGWYSGSTITGEVDETYTMSIEIAGQTYTATSTMFPPPGYRDAWVVAVEKVGGKGGSSGIAYSDEWRVLDPPETRNRYLFEWWTNGRHIVRRDWAIDDNRVVNAGGSLRLFTVTLDPGPNEHIRHRTAEIDKVTYDYYNMYEKIVRGIVSVDSQTPYNPASNFGEGTIGNFRAVAFSSMVVLTPPGISAAGQNEQVVISFPLNEFFSTYNLYWSTAPGVSKESNVIGDLDYHISGRSNAIYTHESLVNDTIYYYRMEVADVDGNVSILSPEVSTAPDQNIPAASGSKPDDGSKSGDGSKTDDGSQSEGNAPTDVIATAGTGEVAVSWTPVAGEVTHGIYWSNEPDIGLSLPREYQIWAGKNNGIAEVSSPFTVTGLESGRTYYFRVAVWDGATVHLSEEVSATPN